ncbi:MAG: glycosyltransferase [Chitinophagaceae bacterium]
MKVLGLITSPIDPASRIRIQQYQKYLTDENIYLQTKSFNIYRDANPAPWTYRLKNITRINEWRTTNILKSIIRLPLLIQQYKYDIIWQNRLVLPYHYFFENKFKKPLVFDFDDAIWLNEGEKHVTAAIKRANCVFAGNSFLADFAESYNKNVVVIPSAVDTKTLYPTKSDNTVFNIGWIGTESNFNYLEIIKPAINSFLAQHPDTTFTVVSSYPPPKIDFDNQRILFKKWELKEENNLINSFSVGLMPLDNTTWTQGKCSYKMLQYMACAKPVIVSPVGTNNEILKEANIGYAATTTDEWVQALTQLYNNENECQQLGKIGLEVIKNKYSCEMITPKIVSAFKNILH